MSNMEFFIGRFEEIDRDEINIEPEDTDDFYEEEERLGYHIVKVEGKLFKFWGIAELDEFGFNTTIPQQDGPLVVCYWYNGGAGLHEVVEAAIKETLNAGKGS
ncbi:hypothetical protein HYO98_gp48 [Dinoroseobacter phage DS-1410Ws-06]|uniref:Uncharacterized protein n=1 Tax=Dinoroseobacter phage DS-1410Ws-06 TaxID=1815983 RepID=A0A191VYC2_9CAUD|nr:hypothetical protein HYO98_gp48 [Dinoroseobacter phage DS-1410Ws-06]ANJ20705.1 hypothetical protein DSp06_gp48 [Dinoroseobacter phage DS-1410Ws-06]